jgi:transposase
MSTKQTRRRFNAEFKVKVVLEALKERSTLAELSHKYEVSQVMCNTPQKHRQWLSSIFESLKPLKHEKHPQKIHSQV